MRFADNALRHATHEDAADASATVRSKHDQIDSFFLRQAKDCADRITSNQTILLPTT